MKVISVIYNRIGIFEESLLEPHTKDFMFEKNKKVKCQAGFCFTNDIYEKKYFFVKTNTQWKLFKADYPIPIPLCALIKQYKTVYLKLKGDLYHDPIHLTKEHKKEIIELIKTLEKEQ